LIVKFSYGLTQTVINERLLIKKKSLWHIKQHTGRDKTQNPDIRKDVTVKEDKLVELSIQASL